MSGQLITDEEHREALRALAKELDRHGFQIMALGSSAILLKTGALGSTKDIDVHPFSIENIEDYWVMLEEVAKALHGNFQFEADGASVTIHIQIRNQMIPVEFIEGREDFIEPHVLADAILTASKIGGVLIPSWEHLVAMKTEAFYDRTGEMRLKYLGDLGMIRERIASVGENVDAPELERVIRLRPPRKHQQMLQTAFRELGPTLRG